MNLPSVPENSQLSRLSKDIDYKILWREVDKRLIYLKMIEKSFLPLFKAF